jgi:hypothetical protein
MLETPRPPEELYLLGLDLGQAQDFTALAALSRRELPGRREGLRRLYHYTLRGLRRWPLGTLYTQIVAEVTGILGQPALAACTLGVDRTGCGQPVVDMLTEARTKANLTCYVRPVLITTGHAVTPDGSGLHVAKVELVTALQVVLQSRRLEIPASIAEAETLQKELLAFRAKVTAARTDTPELDWRDRPHDDMVLAVAIAVFLGEQAVAVEYRAHGRAPDRDADGGRETILTDPRRAGYAERQREREEGRYYRGSHPRDWSRGGAVHPRDWG